MKINENTRNAYIVYHKMKMYIKSIIASSPHLYLQSQRPVAIRNNQGRILPKFTNFWPFWAHPPATISGLPPSVNRNTMGFYSHIKKREMGLGKISVQKKFRYKNKLQLYTMIRQKLFEFIMNMNLVSTTIWNLHFM